MNYSEILQQCKDEVARLNGFENWEDTEFQISQDDESRILHEAALLAMQRVEEAKELPENVTSILKRVKNMYSHYAPGTIGKLISDEADSILNQTKQS